MVEQGRAITSAVSIPVIGDGDTGYGNAINVKRTVRGYAPRRLRVRDDRGPARAEALRTHARQGGRRRAARRAPRIRAAVDAREELRGEGGDILIMARTDARATHGLDEAIARGRAFAELGADIVFVEAPRRRSARWNASAARSTCR